MLSARNAGLLVAASWREERVVSDGWAMRSAASWRAGSGLGECADAASCGIDAADADASSGVFGDNGGGVEAEAASNGVDDVNGGVIVEAVGGASVADFPLEKGHKLKLAFPLVAKI
jgi:hypothetical protein